KMSCSQTNYKLDEAQAIFSELRSIKKAISTGERERQDLIQVTSLFLPLNSLLITSRSSTCRQLAYLMLTSSSLAKLTVNFQSSLSISDAASELANSTPTIGDSCNPQQYCDTGCQTDIMGELLREKEALLQELNLVSRQWHTPGTQQQLEEERCRLEEEVQRAHSSQSQGANQSSISFSDIYGVPQYERHDGAAEPLDPYVRYLLPPESISRDCSVFSPDHLTQNKSKRSHDTPQSLASLSSRSSLSSISPPSSPMDTPYHSAPQDCPLAQMTEEYMEQAGRGLLEGLRSQSQTLSHSVMMNSEDMVSPAALHQLDNKIQRDSGAQTAFTSTALEPQCHMSFNEGFRIPVPANALAVCALQLSVCSLGPQAQEELLGTAKLSLADCEGSAEMVYHWLRVQILSGTDSKRLEQKSLNNRRNNDSQEDEPRPRAMDTVSNLLSRTTTTTHLEERGSELELQRLEKDMHGEVEKATMTEGPFPEPVRVRLKERGGRWGHASPFMRGSTIVRSQTFSPGARSQYVCRQQSYRSSLAEQPTRTSLDLELDLQACRTRQRELMDELSALRELKLRLEEPQSSEANELPNWALRDERFRCLLREAQRQVKLDV
ncbi:hypothetical protein GOODEAATRI_002793, partial [Goodea atripinnis]